MNDTRELCAELYGLTGWIDTTYFDENGKYQLKYSTDYLLDKLPSIITLKSRAGRRWYCSIVTGQVEGNDVTRTELDCTADTPQKALLKLSIELAKGGLLK